MPSQMLIAMFKALRLLSYDKGFFFLIFKCKAASRDGIGVRVCVHSFFTVSFHTDARHSGSS